MFRWLSRYVKQITICGVGIELREIPADEALPLLDAAPRPAPAQPVAGQLEAPAPVVWQQNYLCITGTSASTRRAPRELDLMADGDEIQVHIHAPGRSAPKVWIGRTALEEAFARSQPAGSSGGEITVLARTAHKESLVTFAWDDSSEVEVRAVQWIWVGKHDLTDALAELGVRAPW